VAGRLQLPEIVRVQNKIFETNQNPVTVPRQPMQEALVGNPIKTPEWSGNKYHSYSFIRNEELILLKAEAHANLKYQATDAVAAINYHPKTASRHRSLHRSYPLRQHWSMRLLLTEKILAFGAETLGSSLDWMHADTESPKPRFPTSYDKGLYLPNFPTFIHRRRNKGWD